MYDGFRYPFFADFQNKRYFAADWGEKNKNILVLYVLSDILICNSHCLEIYLWCNSGVQQYDFVRNI